MYFSSLIPLSCHYCSPAIVAYRLTGSISAFAQALDNTKKNLGKFIIVTNQLEANRLSSQAMLKQYIALWHC